MAAAASSPRLHIPVGQGALRDQIEAQMALVREEGVPHEQLAQRVAGLAELASQLQSTQAYIPVLNFQVIQLMERDQFYEMPHEVQDALMATHLICMEKMSLLGRIHDDVTQKWVDLKSKFSVVNAFMARASLAHLHVRRLVLSTRGANLHDDSKEVAPSQELLKKTGLAKVRAEVAIQAAGALMKSPDWS